MDYSQYEAEIYAKLQPLGDPARSAFVKNYMKSQLEFLAIKVPVMRQVAREGFSFYSQSLEEILAIWNAIWFSSSCFEVMCMPLFYYDRQGRKISPTIWPTLSTWSEHVENWAHSDSLALIYSYLLAQNFDEVYKVLQEWNNAENQWLRRLSMVSLIHYSGKKAVFLPLDKVLPMLENCLDDERPYVQKAIGWVLREANYVYHAEVSAFIERHLADLRGIAFSAATERFSEAERGAFIERRKALRAQSKIVVKRLEAGGETA
ncbi:MAG: DNA alkylation repair protein [Ktedonobacteraceae bacterium]